MEAVILFRKRLQECVERLLEQLDKTERSIDMVAQTWKDTQFLKFCTGFDEDKERIKILSEKVADWDQFVFDPLQKKLEYYLSL